ncbi:hypothetical protein AX17_000149 [Amanita inopinata Kibby_2008]|nr:hypothetical protein AX17_000149 [Amanita inopinata Kibby_2008]
MTAMPRKKPLTSLRVDTPAHASHTLLSHRDSDASTLSSDSGLSLFNSTSRSQRNMKKLSISIPSAHSSTNSLQLPTEPQSAVTSKPPDFLPNRKARRPSVISLPITPTPNPLLHRKDEDGSPTVPYADGPTQIIPGIWLGSEDNARDWQGLVERGITSMLNVAKEVTPPFESLQPLSIVASGSKSIQSDCSTYYPPHIPSGRPGMHYLKLPWSHGQQNLVEDGFKQAMVFIDAALERGDGVLIHCQCGISRSATLVIALVMRAAAERDSNVPPEVWTLKGMHGAYSFVKEKSRWISPNMSLIYQLLEYQKRLKNETSSLDSSEQSSSSLAEEEEWGRQRQLLDELPAEDDDDRESTFIMHEAQALDRAMEDRFVARRSSSSSLCSANSGYGMGPEWRSRYGSRKRTGSIASSHTNGSILSEDLVEEDEEPELLGVGGGFDSEKNVEESSSTTSPDEDLELNERISAHPQHVPPSASSYNTAFNIPSLPTVIRSSPGLFRPLPRPRRRPPPIGLPPVPSSPVTVVMDSSETTTATIIPEPPKPFSPTCHESSSSQQAVESPWQPKAEKAIPPSLHLRHTVLRKNRVHKNSHAESSPWTAMPQTSTPSQTLFVFPPSPTAVRTPSTLTITSTPSALSLPSGSPTPRVSAFRPHARPRSFIGINTPATPTTAFTKLNVRGYVGIQS